MSFNPATLETKLSQVTETQDSITGTSQWILFHKRYAADAAAVWAQSLASAPENLKLGLIYVANEVVQQAKNKNREAFVAAWADVLPGALGQVYSQLPSQVQDRITRVIKVWRDRKVFSSDVMRQIEAGVGNTGSFSAAPGVAPRQANIPPELQPIVSAWLQLAAVPKTESIVSSTEAAESAAALAATQLEGLSKIEHQFAQALATRKSALQEAARVAKETLGAAQDPNEEPSPAIEADSEPEIYTAGNARDDDDDNDDDDDSAPAPAPAPSLDPKLMSFLASMGG